MVYVMVFMEFIIGLSESCMDTVELICESFTLMNCVRPARIGSGPQG